MDVDFLLEMGEGTFERIGGIWHAKIGVMFKGKKPREIGVETSVSAAQSFVREMPSF